MERSGCQTPPKRRGAQFARFFIVGVGATLVHWGVYLALNGLLGLSEEDKEGLVMTYSAGYAVSFIGNYIASLKWTFRTKGSVGKGMGFAFSHVVNYGMHVVLLAFFMWIGVGQALVSVLQFLAPWLAEAFPFLAEPDSLLPLPVFLIAVPVNFVLVRFFLTYGDEKKLD